MWMRQVLDCVVFNSLSSVLDQILQYQIKIILNNAGIKSAVKEKSSWIVWLSVLKIVDGFSCFKQKIAPK